MKIKCAGSEMMLKVETVSVLKSGLRKASGMQKVKNVLPLTRSVWPAFKL